MPGIGRTSISAAVTMAVLLMGAGALGREASDRLCTRTGQWWQYRGDQRLSGRALIRGQIEQPAIEWAHPIAGRETLLAVRMQPGPSAVSLPAADEAAVPGREEWGQVLAEWEVAGPYGTSWLDPDGSGELTPVTRHYNQKIGKVLPGQPGLQLIETEAKGYPKIPGVYKGTVRLKVREKGQWVTRWETETDTLIWQSEPIFGDFDGDGRNEIALLPWYRLTVLDAATGKLKEQCNYLAEDESENPGLGGRAYGWFGAVDVEGDRQPEFVILEDFIRYAAVIGRRDGKLQRLWLKVWEPRKPKGESLDPEAAVVVRVNPEPVQDVDADGRREIILSVFNHAGDNRWHVLVLDALTGAAEHDLPGQFLTGLRDADGDGIPELFCTAAARGPRLPEPSLLSLYALKGGKASRIWKRTGASFVTYGVGHFPAHVNSGAALGGETILCGPFAPGGPSVFFSRTTRRPDSSEVELTCWQAGSGTGFRPVATWIGPGLQPLMVRARGEGAPVILLQAAAHEEEPASLRCPGGRVRTSVLASRRAPAPVSPVVVGRPQPGALPVIVMQGANETVEAFRPTAEGKTQRLWRVPGRGMTCNNYYEGLLLADLAGDGRLAVVMGTRGRRGCARLTARALSDGRALWSRDFEEFPGTPPPWNVPGLMYWQGGYFRDPRRMDLLVQMRRVGGESYLLDGRSGKTVWRQAKGRPGRDFGRDWMAMLDFDGDGLEDILNLYPDMFCVARGRDGALLVAEESVKYVDHHAYYAGMIAADFLGRGRPQILYLHEAVTALLTGQGEPGTPASRAWKVDHPHPGEWRNPAGFGDADGDGRMELFFPGARGKAGREFQCRDAETGALEWSLPMPDAPFTYPTVADIDSDGHDECLFAMENTLYAIGTVKSGDGGAVRWKLVLPARAGPLAIADVAGDGSARVVAACADGYVYGIGPAPSPAANRPRGVGCQGEE